MATVTRERGRFIEITWLTAVTDWVFEDELNDAFVALGAIKVKSILFNPSGADTFVIREGGLTGPIIMNVKPTATTDQRVKYFGDEGTWMKPYIEADNQTFADFTLVSVVLELA